MYYIIQSKEDFDNLKIVPNEPIFCDTETYEDEGLSSGGLYGKIRLFQLKQPHMTKAILIDCKFISLISIVEKIQHNHTVWFNAAFDLHTINRKFHWIPEKIDDCLLMSRIIYNDKSKFSFYDCLRHAELNDRLIDSIDKKENQTSNWGGILTEKQRVYAACDVIYLEKLYYHLIDLGSSPIYKMDIYTLKLCIKLTKNGMPVSQSKVQKEIQNTLSIGEDAYKQLPYMDNKGTQLNPRSSTQCKKVLNTKSSDDTTLSTLIQEGSDLALCIKTCRKAAKKLEYLEVYNRPKIYGFFLPSTSISGRFSCSGGNVYGYCNLQQIPKDLRYIVEAPKGKVLVHKDYSGLELRMAAAFTGDPVMCSALIEGADFHSITGKEIYGKEEITSDERAIGKKYNFTLIYGAGPAKLQTTLRVEAGVHFTIKEIRGHIKTWFNIYEYFKKWHNRVKNELKLNGTAYVQTALGRSAYIDNFALALNFPIQGSSVEVTKLALALLHQRYPELEIINVIHDEFVLLEDEDKAEESGKKLDECMTDAWYMVIKNLNNPDIPMPKGFEINKNWGK